MEIYTTIEPYELAENVSDQREACDICVEILHQWNLPQEMYEEILEEIPEDAIKQYLRKTETNGKGSSGEPDRDTEE